MLSLSDRLTVPQVFFNEKHIGGADDTLALLVKVEKQFPSAEEYYKNEIASQPDPEDPRLAVPTTPPVQEKPAPPRDHEKSVDLPDGTKGTVLEVVTKLQQILPQEDLKFNITLYKKCFRGSDGVAALKKGFNIATDREAVAFGKSLVRSQILHHVVDDHDFANDSSLFFRLHCYQEPLVLNSFRVWTERVDKDGVSLMKRLKKLLGKVESAVTNSEGLVDYKNAHKHELYPVFEEAVCELQRVDMGAFDEDTKLAFGINLYNTMIKYAFMKVGIGSTTFARNSFFSGVSMNVGGHILSFNDLENGVLRANRKGPANLTLPFPKDDKRLVLARKQVDCRIHFGLNCGAKSCPPVKNFTPQAIEEELRIVAQAFCEQEDNVRVDVENKTLYLTSILKWFRPDFAESKEALPQAVVHFLRGEKQKKLQSLIDRSEGIKIKFNEYDWGTNASDFVPFDSAVLKANVTKLL